MSTTARSIDSAARGYIRHRFVRALSASIVVFAVFGLIAVSFGAIAHAVMIGAWNQVLVSPLGIVLMLLIFMLPLMLIVGVIGGVIDALHRRIIGLALVLFGLFCVVICGTAPLYAYMAVTGHIAEVSTEAARIEAVWFGVFGIVAAIVGYELLRHGWWQMSARAEDFRAVRGWRPPAWRLLTSFRRYLGLPGFLSYVGKKRRLVSVLYFGVATLNLGLLTLLMLPMFAGGQSNQTQDFNAPLTFGVLGGLLVLNLIGAGNWLARLADRRATALYQNVREWDQRAPVIFLRAFDQDDARLRARGGDAFARWPAGVGRARTLDEILLEHASPYGPVIAIGDPRDPTPPLGAARVFVREQGNGWQDVVRDLAGASKVVVMCPNHGEGVQWELDLIAQAAGRVRTIFLASPELDRDASLALFARLVPEMPALDAKQLPLAAYALDGYWRVLTSKNLSVESYTTALNTALQAMFGLKGEPIKQKAPA